MTIKRINYNVELLETLKDYLLANPNVRFCQALYNLRIVDKKDRYNEESSRTLSRVRENLEYDDEDFLY
jgi:hypothetical protein